VELQATPSYSIPLLLNFRGASFYVPPRKFSEKEFVELNKYKTGKVIAKVGLSCQVGLSLSKVAESLARGGRHRQGGQHRQGSESLPGQGDHRQGWAVIVQGWAAIAQGWQSSPKSQKASF